MNTVLCNMKVSNVKLASHRMLIIFAILLASGDVESNPGPGADHCRVHCANESVFPCGYCPLAIGWTHRDNITNNSSNKSMAGPQQ